MSNPYEAPDADIRAPGEDEEYDPKLFSFNGRIGRARYLAFGFILLALVSIPIGAIIALVAPNMESDLGGASLFLIIPLYIAMFVASFAVARRRFHDLNQSSWLFLTLIIPFINMIASLYLLFWPGTKGSNKYGPPPTKNSTLVWIFLGLAVVASIGVLAAVALPAYQSYLEAAS